jgi:hypothetical protein
MRRWFITVVAGGMIAVGLGAPVAAKNHGHEHAFCSDAGLPGYSEFGRHVSAMARDGHLGAEHNPGMHNGYSVCIVSHDH